MPEPIRILRVIARLNMGGPAIHVANLAAGLETRGYHTTLVAGSLARGEDSMAYVAERLGVNVVDVPEIQREVALLHDAKSVRRLTAIMREERPHILHTHTAKAGALARAAAVAAGRGRPPIIVHTFHGHVLKGYFGPGRTAFFRQVERVLARQSDVLIAVSPEVRDELVEHGVAPSEKFAVIRLGIPLDERLGDASAELDYRRLYGIAADAFVVGWVGRMTGVKDTGAVLEIVRATRERGVDAVLCMVGDGPDRERLEQLAHDLGIARSTFFVGYQEDVARLLPALRRVPAPIRERGHAGERDRGARLGNSRGGDARRRRARRRARRRRRLPRRARRHRSGRRAARGARSRSGAPETTGGCRARGTGALLGHASRRRRRPSLPVVARRKGDSRALGLASTIVAVVPEATIERTEEGLVPVGEDGWFVLNAREAAWRRWEGMGSWPRLEGSVPRFGELGVGLTVLEPGEPMSMYHWETDQEGFLVLDGEALLVVEGQERPLRAWDFVHCPPGTRHAIVGAGEGPCVVFAVGSRVNHTFSTSDGAIDGRDDWGVYTVDEAALRHGAGVSEETTNSDAAYGHLPEIVTTPYPDAALPDLG